MEQIDEIRKSVGRLMLHETYSLNEPARLILQESVTQTYMMAGILPHEVEKFVKKRSEEHEERYREFLAIKERHAN